MNNEMVIYESIERQLKQVRKENIFPLSPTHRKELRGLKSQNVGNLHNQLKTIKTLKKEEYIKKYRYNFKIDLDKKNKLIQQLNNEWATFIKDIKKFISERIQHEDKLLDFVGWRCKSDYNSIAKLDVDDLSLERNIYLDLEKATKEIAEKEFDQKYSEPFKKVEDQIFKIEQMYEEAINFGDLELVKKLYYIMKSSDKLFEKIDLLKI